MGKRVIKKVKSTSMVVENLRKMIEKVGPVPTKEQAINALGLRIILYIDFIF